MDAIKQVWEGKAGLARTYWLWGVLASLPWALILGVVPRDSTAAILVVFAFLLYFLLVNVGVWRAATAYTGPTTWAMLAKVASGLGVFLVLLGVVTLWLALNGKSLEVPRAAAPQAPLPPQQQAPYTSPPGFKPFTGKLDGE